MKAFKKALALSLVLFTLFTGGAFASQHDYEISTADANTGASYRQAANAALQALASLSSGETEPTTPYPFQLWADTTNNLLKIRNAANNSWISIGILSDIYLGLAATFDENSFAASQQIDGDALLLRLNDTGTSGEEWAIRSDGGNFEVVKNTGSEASPTWTVQARIDVNALRVGNGTASDIRFIANNNGATKPEIRYQASTSTWQFSNDGVAYNSIGAASESSAAPTGTVIAFAGESAPAGYLECNGSAVNRTTYSALFAVIGTMYGPGNGTTTFNVPDYRGRLLRGWDHGAGIDPDRASRTDRGDGTTGDNVGTRQADAYKSHNHTASTSTSVSLSANYAWHSPSSSGYDGGNYPTNPGYDIAANTASASSSTTVNASGGNETRPININVMYCIKY